MQKYSGSGRPMPSPREASILLQKFKEAQEKGWKIYYEPLYSYVNLPALADATGELPNTITFFGKKVGDTESSFGREITLAETNLVTSSSQFDSNAEYVAYSLGVDVHENNPLNLKAELLQNAFLVQSRGATNQWPAGAIRFWPMGDIGLISQSVEITSPDALIEFARNGSRGAVCFPPGGEIYFPPLNQIKFTVGLSEATYATTDGLPINEEGTNAITKGYLGVVLYGFKFERVTP